MRTKITLAVITAALVAILTGAVMIITAMVQEWGMIGLVLKVRPIAVIILWKYPIVRIGTALIIGGLVTATSIRAKKGEI